MSEQKQRIREMLRGPLESVIAPRQQARLATISSAFDRTGRIKPETIGAAVTIPIYLRIAGALAIGNGVGGVHARARVLQAVTIGQVRADAETGPASPNSCTLHIVADGVRIIEVNIAAGVTVGVSPASADVDAGALLTVDCADANGASDVTLAIATRPRGR